MKMKNLLAFSLIGLSFASLADPAVTEYVDLVTNRGTATFGLYGKDAPITTQNFLSYVDANAYTNTMIHRLVPGFVMQGGGYTIYGSPIKTFAPIANESGVNKIKNSQGTVAMARATASNSATSQFFINLVDNSAALDFGSQNAPDGYAVFANVVAGSNVVTDISGLTSFNPSVLAFPLSATGTLVSVVGTYKYSLSDGATPRLRILTVAGGKVRSQPGGICSSGSCMVKVTSGQKINLVATPDKNKIFMGWAGDCVGGDRTTSIKIRDGVPSSQTCIAVFSN